LVVGLVDPAARAFLNERARIFGTKTERRSAPIGLADRFPPALDGDPASQARSITKPLRRAGPGPGEILDIREPRVPAHMLVRSLGEAPNRLRIATDRCFRGQLHGHASTPYIRYIRAGCLLFFYLI